MPTRTLGIEEEFLLVDPASARPRAIASTVLRLADERDCDLTGELQAEQLETATQPCIDLDDLVVEIRTRRREAAAAARRAGVEALPLATSPVPTAPHVADNPRYRAMVHRFGLTAREQLTCGCHVHVAVDSEDEAVAVVDRIQPWLAPVLALSVNSPLWDGADSGYCSFRNQVWSRWPSAGPTGPFGSAAGYHRIVEELLRTDTLLDRGMLYFDARLSHRHPTVEIRVADVCREPQDAVLIAALVRGLVETATREWGHGQPTACVRIETLRLAAWRAARSGIDDVLLMPHRWHPAPAAQVIQALIDHVARALTDNGELTTVQELWQDLQVRRPGAHHQRLAYRDHGPRGVVQDALQARDRRDQ